MSTIRHAARSDPGRRHRENQDRWFADDEAGLYLVSDGMAEDVSPQLVVDTLPALLRDALANVRDLSEPTAPKRVRAALTDVSAFVVERSQNRLDMLGATVVLALVCDGRALLAHLGDSRIYLSRDGRLKP